MKKTRYAAVGTGGRIVMFIDPIVKTYGADAELVGLCDTSETRRTYHQQRLSREYGMAPVKTYADFDQMMDEQRPDCVIVCVPDYLHHEFIVRALDRGADVISEKPLTTDADKYRQIAEAVQRTGRRVRTTFNMRWTAGIGKVRELIAAGEIGEVKHVDFEYFLNTSHGADYFRRWHSQKKFSGGLLIHKSTHHFDVINWWINGIPRQVFAMGDLVFYGKKNAEKRGDHQLTTYRRYQENPDPAADPFHLDIAENETMRALYLDAEKDSGYLRDENVFREGITIEDSMSLLIKYRDGTMVTYSLNAYSPSEGFRASISGDRGRIEYYEPHATHIITGDEKVELLSTKHQSSLILQKHFQEPQDVEIEVLTGGHGGGDPRLQEQIFSHHPPADTMGRNAGHEQGAASLLIGAAANISMTTNQPVQISDLVELRPDAIHLNELI